jgi:hypothetical protein
VILNESDINIDLVRPGTRVTKDIRVFDLDNNIYIKRD